MLYVFTNPSGEVVLVPARSAIHVDPAYREVGWHLLGHVQVSEAAAPYCRNTEHYQVLSMIVFGSSYLAMMVALYLQSQYDWWWKLALLSIGLMIGFGVQVVSHLLEGARMRRDGYRL